MTENYFHSVGYNRNKKPSLYKWKSLATPIQQGLSEMIAASATVTTLVMEEGNGSATKG